MLRSVLLLVSCTVFVQAAVFKMNAGVEELEISLSATGHVDWMLNAAKFPTFPGYQCAAGMLLRMGASGWECATAVGVGDELDVLLGTCTPGDIPKWDGAAWQCGTDEDFAVTGAGTGSTEQGMIWKYDGATWALGNDADTLTGVSCAALPAWTNSGMARYSGTAWECETAENSDVIADNLNLSACTDDQFVVSGATVETYMCMDDGDKLTELGCAAGVPKYSLAMGDWYCGQDTDTWAKAMTDCTAVGGDTVISQGAVTDTWGEVSYPYTCKTAPSGGAGGASIVGGVFRISSSWQPQWPNLGTSETYTISASGLNWQDGKGGTVGNFAGQNALRAGQIKGVLIVARSIDPATPAVQDVPNAAEYCHLSITLNGAPIDGPYPADDTNGGNNWMSGLTHDFVAGDWLGFDLEAQSTDRQVGCFGALYVEYNGTV